MPFSIDGAGAAIGADATAEFSLPVSRMSIAQHPKRGVSSGASTLTSCRSGL